MRKQASGECLGRRWDADEVGPQRGGHERAARPCPMRMAQCMHQQTQSVPRPLFSDFPPTGTPSKHNLNASKCIPERLGQGGLPWGAPPTVLLVCARLAGKRSPGWFALARELSFPPPHATEMRLGWALRGRGVNTRRPSTLKPAPVPPPPEARSQRAASHVAMDHLPAAGSCRSRVACRPGRAHTAATAFGASRCCAVSHVYDQLALSTEYTTIWGGATGCGQPASVGIEPYPPRRALCRAGEARSGAFCRTLPHPTTQTPSCRPTKVRLLVQDPPQPLPPTRQMPAAGDDGARGGPGLHLLHPNH